MLTACLGCENGPDRDGCPDHSHDLGPYDLPCGVDCRGCSVEEMATDRHHRDDHGPDQTQNAMKRTAEYEPTVSNVSG